MFNSFLNFTIVISGNNMISLLTKVVEKHAFTKHRFVYQST